MDRTLRRPFRARDTSRTTASADGLPFASWNPTGGVAVALTNAGSGQAPGRL